ncbi:MAG TPA: C4-type zinc ribbon domain-containing protein [Vicinamibacterales bacterium]|nr:C4-type zinc ribbon domain-containing protein [Vicinamibacterales bacterium]
MLPDLQHLIHLQEIDSAIERARRRIGEIPGAQAALESRAAERAAAVQAIKERIAATSSTRREVEKEVAAIQTRLSKYKDQLMAVKTNKEYQAMQTEIATAEGLVRSHEDKLLDLMEVSEQESADLKSAEAAMKSEQAAIAAQQKALEAEISTREAELQRLTDERAGLMPQISKEALTIFERVAHGRKGVAVAEARDGLCVVCHVRLRPQMFNEVRRNDTIVQCDSCTRILYYVPPPAPSTTAQS